MRVRRSSLVIVGAVALTVALNLLVSINTVSRSAIAAHEQTLSVVAQTFETSLSAIEDAVYSATLDQVLLREIEEYLSGDEMSDADLFDTLRAIQLRSRHISEVAMYFPSLDRVVLGGTGVTLPVGEFRDRVLVTSGSHSTNSTYSPRMVTIYDREGLYISLIGAVPGMTRLPKGYLVAYVDARRMFHEIANNLIGDFDGSVVHAIRAGEIVLSTDSTRLFDRYEPDRSDIAGNLRRIIAATVGTKAHSRLDLYSERLNWQFVLESGLQSPRLVALQFRLTSVALLVLLIITTLIARNWYKKTRVFERAFQRSAWTRYLTDGEIPADGKSLPSRLLINPNTHCLALCLLESRADRLGSPEQMAKVERWIADTFPEIADRIVLGIAGRIAIVLGVIREDVDETAADFAGKLGDFGKRVFAAPCVVAYTTARDDGTMLPLAYRECLEVLNHKMCLATSVLSYAELNRRTVRHDYPFEVENKLINALGADLPPGSTYRDHLEEFLSYLRDPEHRVDDATFVAHLSQLCNSVQRHAFERYGIGSVAPGIGHRESGAPDPEHAAHEYLRTMQYQITEHTSGTALDDEIIQYLDDHVCDPSLDLNHLADVFGNHRNHVSRVVQARTGVKFTTYLRHRRVEHAKDLLVETRDSIGDVAVKCGFAYTHHFIRVFKNLEGLTPGQYRRQARLASVVKV